MNKLGIRVSLFLFLLFLFCGTNCRAVLAGPHFALTPSSGSFASGVNFTTTISIDSGTEKSSALDIYGTFDSTKLEIVSIVKAATPAFSFDLTPTINNATGKFNFSCVSTDMTSFEDKVLTGDLAVITFKAKDVSGVATVGFSCTSGSTIDSNIFKSSGVDIVDCVTNQGGSYTITAAAGGTTAPTAVPTTVAAAGESVATPTVKATQLPKTGGIASTLGLVIFGGVSVLGALFLRIL